MRDWRAGAAYAARITHIKLFGYLSTDKTEPRGIASWQGTKCFPHHVIGFASLDRLMPRYGTVRHLANEAPPFAIQY